MFASQYKLAGPSADQWTGETVLDTYILHEFKAAGCDMAGENLDLNSEPAPDWGAGQGRCDGRFLGVRFACCNVYTRIYVNRRESAYEGNCPRCGRAVRIRIAPGGTDKRFFTVS